MWTPQKSRIKQVVDIVSLFCLHFTNVLLRMSATWDMGLWIIIGHFYTILAIEKLPVLSI